MRENRLSCVAACAAGGGDAESRLGDADARRRGVRDERVSESVGEGSPQHSLEGNFAPHSRPGAADVGRTAHSHALPQAACRGAASRRFARLAVHSPRRRPFRRPTQPLHPRPRRQPLPRCARSIRTRRGSLGHPAQADQGRHRPCQAPQAHPKTLVAPKGRNCTPSICAPEAGA